MLSAGTNCRGSQVCRPRTQKGEYSHNCGTEQPYFTVNPNVNWSRLPPFFWRRELLLLWLVVNPIIRQGFYLQRSILVHQMGSGLPRHVHVSAHDWRQVLTFQGKSCSVFGSFTK